MIDFSAVAVRQPIVAPDPWGTGVRFLLRRTDAEVYTRAIKRRKLSAPAALKAAMGMVPGAMAGKGEAPDIDLAEYIADARGAGEAVAETLLCGWEGGDQEYSPEAAQELLSREDIVPDGAPFEGMAVGAALRAFIVRAAEAGTKAQDQEEALEKKASASSDDGDSPTAT